MFDYVFMAKNRKVVRAVGYFRVSSNRQFVDGHGLESQKSRVVEHCAKSGYDMITSFQDVYSGKGDYKKRPGLSKMLEYVRGGKVDVVLADDQKRIARDTLAYLQLKQYLSKKNVRLEFLNANTEDTVEGRYIETVLAATGQLEREQNAIQVRNKMRARKKAGCWVTCAPVGYMIVDDIAYGKILGFGSESDVNTINEGFTRFADGRLRAVADVVRYFESKGLKTSRGGYMKYNGVRKLLSSPVYIGKTVVDEELYEGKHDGIVSEAVFKAVQERLKDKRALYAKMVKNRSRKNRQADFELSGVLRCGVCQTRMSGIYSKYKYPNYVCAKKCCVMRNRTRGNKQANLEHEVKLFMKAVSERAEETLYSKILDMRDGAMDNRSEVLDEIKSLDSRVLAAKSERSAKLIEKEIEKLESEINDEKYNECLKELQKVPCTKIRLFVNMLKNLDIVYDSVDMETKKVLLRYIFPDGITITPKGDTLYQLKVLEATDRHKKTELDAQYWIDLLVVDPSGLEPLTSCVQSRRSSQMS